MQRKQRLSLAFIRHLSAVGMQDAVVAVTYVALVVDYSVSVAGLHDQYGDAAVNIMTER